MMGMGKRALLLAGALFFAAGAMSLTGCGGGLPAGLPAAGGGKAGQAVKRDVFAMDTFMTMTAYGPGAEAALEQGEAEIRRLDSLFSTGKPDSELGRLNQWSQELEAGAGDAARTERPGEAEDAAESEDTGLPGQFRLSEEAFALLERAMELSREMEGAFDPAVYPLMRLWGFAGKEGEERTPAKPEDREIRALLPLCRPENVVLRPENHALEVTVPGTMLDLGGAVKGYASARLMELFREQGVSSALVNLGGNVQVLGTKPDGSLWRIGIEDPEREGNIAALSLTDTAAVTSGGYERGFEEDGRRYHHLLDPETGYPAEGGLLSVTVLTPDGALADMLSTALFVMGRERAEAFIARRAADWQFEAVLVTEDRELLATEGLRDRLESRENIGFIAQIR